MARITQAAGRTTAVLLIAALVWTTAHPMGASAQSAGDKLVVPGERIGNLRVASRLADLEASLGRGTPTGRGVIFSDSTFYQWDAAGLAAIADDVTGNVLWISVCACGSNPWAGFATAEGAGFGLTEEQVVAAMGTPQGTFADFTGKSLYYSSRGIAFFLAATGPEAGKVAGFRIYWAFRAPGDQIVIPGRRMSVANVGMSLTHALAVLGGGYTLRRLSAGVEGYHWPHFGLTIFVDGGAVIEVGATWSGQLEWAGVRYATTEGLGFGSMGAQIRSALGEPADRRQSGTVETWGYPSRGIAYAIDVSRGLVIGIYIFSPR